MASLWGVPALPGAPGKTAIEMFEAVRRGDIKLLWIACTNPAQSLPDQALVREALERAEMVVLQEAFATTETAPYADVLLPAATWAEKEGTVTNSERRISRVRAAVRAPGAARYDWSIAVAFAHKLEARLKPGTPTLFPYESPEDIFNEFRATTSGRDLDIGGLSYALLETRGPQQWPYPDGATQGVERLYADGVFATPNGRAAFANASQRPVAEEATARRPFRLITGRLRDQWHGMSRTGRSARLFGHAPEPRLTMNPADLGRRMIAAGDFVEVSSARGTVTLQVEAGDDLRPGQAFLPMHWGSTHLGGAGTHGINGVTLATFDPVSRQPELKHCAVRITKAELPWRLVAFAYAPDGDALALAEAARRFFPSFTFATCVLVGREREGVLFRAASPAPADASVVAALDTAFGLTDGPVLSYDDARRGVGRRVRVRGGSIDAVRLAGDFAAEPWLRDLFDRQEAVLNLGAMLLAPAARLPSGPPRGKTVCTCWNVGENAICDFVAAASPSDGNVLGALQSALKCGTECGSCVPELKRLVATAKAAA
jgi:assimilatory nitrate reductase catalytic subunit